MRFGVVCTLIDNDTRHHRPRLQGSRQIFARMNFAPGPPVYMNPCKFDSATDCSGVYTITGNFGRNSNGKVRFGFF